MRDEQILLLKLKWTTAQAARFAVARNAIAKLDEAYKNREKVALPHRLFSA